MDLDARWAKRDRQREAEEAHYEALRQEARAKHVDIVEVALLAAMRTDARLFPIAGRVRTLAETAVDALIADGVVFARMGSWDDPSGLPT